MTNEVVVDLQVSTPDEDKTNLYNVLAMFYQAVYSNQVGIVQTINVETGKKELCLAGLESHPDGTRYVPIAVALDAASSALYVPLEASEDVREEEDVE